MLYNLLYPLSVDYSILNIFKYITFRSAWALVTALAVSILVGPYFIRWLQAIKCRQEILKEVKAHQCKAGTPTMGGLLIVFAVSVSVLLWADLTNAYVWMTMLVFIGFSAVGFIDDFMKVSHHQNKGLSPRAKFAGQMLVAGIAMLLLVSEPAYSTRLAFPFFKTLNPDLGYWYIPFAMLVMVGTSNAVNLTDGLDGLAIGPMVVAGLVFSVYITSRGMCASPSTCNLNIFPGWARSRFSAVRWLARGLGSSGSTPIPPRCSWATWGRSGSAACWPFSRCFASRNCSCSSWAACSWRKPSP